jgi:hypothetical protein
MERLNKETTDTTGTDITSATATTELYFQLDTLDNPIRKIEIEELGTPGSEQQQVVTGSASAAYQATPSSSRRLGLAGCVRGAGPA